MREIGGRSPENPQQTAPYNLHHVAKVQSGAGAAPPFPDICLIMRGLIAEERG